MVAAAQGRLRLSTAPCGAFKTLQRAARQCQCRVAQDEKTTTVSVPLDGSAAASEPPSATLVPSWNSDVIPYMLACASLFAIIAIDVNVESSAHLLSGVDSLTHNAVASTVPFEFRRDVADAVISDVPIETGSLAAVAGVAAITMLSARQGLAVGAVMLVANAAVGGVFFGKDAVVTTALKRTFHRARPSDDLHHSFSFPSGHSTSVYFVAGFLFCIVLPMLNEVFQEDSNEEDTGIKQTLATLSQPKVAIPLTIATGVTTQSGRILADVHWVSDTLAGACLGSMGVLVSWTILAKWRQRLQ